jgi:two-component system KDP operon response regulator KdpE
MPNRILVIDDEPQITRVLRAALTAQSFDVRTANEPEEGLQVFKDWSPDLVITDLMMPGLSGVEVCRAIRTQSAIPVLVLSVRDHERSKVEALDAGADDYVTKPFSPRELRARIRAMLRRTETEAAGEVHRFGRFELDLARFELRREGKQLEATHTELKLLTAFIRSRGRVLTREQLLEAVWGSGVFVSDRVVDYHIVALRKKIEDDPAAPRHLVSVRGVGYRFDG